MRQIESHEERRAIVERMAASLPASPPSQFDMIMLLTRYVKDLENRVAAMERM